MNDLGREVLVKAAMDGVKQIKGRFKDNEGGYCAMGLLVANTPECKWMELYEAEVWFIANPDADAVASRYDITPSEWMDIVEANNVKGWDFLTIARKF